MIENFLTADEIAEALEAGKNLYKNAPEEDRKTFFASVVESNEAHYKENYFIKSSNKVHYFFENDALDERGNLVVDPAISLNKVGHALHTLHPTFNKITHNERMRKIAADLGFRKPAVPQSMYIFKNPGIGGEGKDIFAYLIKNKYKMKWNENYSLWLRFGCIDTVKIHQDASYMYTEPNSLVGFWIPLEDATLENGCLWFVKGSHKNGLKRRWVQMKYSSDFALQSNDFCLFCCSRLIRNPDKTSDKLLIYDRPYDASIGDQRIACPVKKGSLVLIHGFVVHSSEANTSTKSRHAYTFHILESDNCHYSEENWLQYPEGESFPAL